jgi:hypothetical protein
MDSLRQRTLGKILEKAVVNPISGALIAAGIVLVGLQVPIPVLSSPPFYASPLWWLAAIVPAWLAVVGGRLTSRETSEQAVKAVLREQFDVNQISSPNLRMNVAQAIAYRERIDKAVERFKGSGMETRMQDVANQVEEWVRRIYTLAVRADAFRNDNLIHADLVSVPETIKKLKQRWVGETNEGLKRDLENTIAQKQAQLDNLKNLAQTMDRAELQMENTLTALGTVYSQMLLLDAKDVDSAKTQRLRDNIVDQVNSLNDVISSMDEVYRSDDQILRSRDNLSPLPASEDGRAKQEAASSGSRKS